MKILFLSLLCIIYCITAFPRERANTSFGKVLIEDFALLNSNVAGSNSNTVLPHRLIDLYTLSMQIQDRIQFRTRIKLGEIVFPAEDYNSLQDFFAFIIKKYGEQIV